MNIKQVKYFISVAECKSLSAAARRQGVSVQAMSKAMKDFERELPAPLLERHSDGVTLTAFGEEFYRKACPARDAFRELETMTDRDASDARPLRVLLCSPSFWHSKRAQASMESYFTKSLGMEAEVSIGAGEPGLEALRNGDYDAMITIGTLEREGFDCVPVGTVPTGISVSKNHPLANHTSVTLEDIAPFPAISSRVFDHFNESILVTYRKDGLDMEIVEPEPSDLLGLVDLFYRKHGVCFMAEVPALGGMFVGSVVIPFAEKDAKAIPLCLISPKHAKTSAYLQLEELAGSTNVTGAL